jgi:hypothetical protein
MFKRLAGFDMRHDMHPNERVFSSKEVAEEVGMHHQLFENMGEK